MTYSNLHKLVLVIILGCLSNAGFSQSIFNFDEGEFDSESQEEIPVIGDEDEESIKQQQEQSENSDEYSPYEEFNESSAEEETRESAYEIRTSLLLDKGASAWIGEAKPFSAFGVTYFMAKSAKTFDSISLGAGQSNFSNASSGVAYKTEFSSVNLSMDVSHFPFDSMPVKFTGGVGLSYLDGKIKNASLSDGSISNAESSYSRYLFTGFAGVGFLKFFPTGYFFGVEVLSSTKAVSLGGDDTDLGESFQENIDETLGTLRIIPPLNLAFGKFF